MMILRCSTRGAARAGAVFALLAAVAPNARAQANLSSQGFGFPSGQFSTRTWGTGGAIAELDPLSPVNPASIALHSARIVTFQIEPEFRTVTSPAGTEHTTTARYPNVFAGVPIGRGWVLGVGASTLLDRTSTTRFKTTQILSGADTVPMNTTYRVDGAMADVRVAAAWNARPWLRFGVGAHAITGHNLVSISQSFADSLQFSAFSQSLVLGFSGSAASAGVQLVSKSWSLGLSGRAGGPLHVSVEDTVLARAHVPTRFGASVAYTGIGNSAIAVHAAHDSWSSLDGLGSAALKGVDAWDTGIGADMAGPRIGSQLLYVRAGFRDRTLPFQANGHDVKETSGTGGLGTTFANGRVLADFAAIYANRSAGLSATEHAWTLSLGIGIRP